MTIGWGQVFPGIALLGAMGVGYASITGDIKLNISDVADNQNRIAKMETHLNVVENQGIQNESRLIHIEEQGNEIIRMLKEQRRI